MPATGCTTSSSRSSVSRSLPLLPPPLAAFAAALAAPAVPESATAPATPAFAVVVVVAVVVAIAVAVVVAAVVIAVAAVLAAALLVGAVAATCLSLCRTSRPVRPSQPDRCGPTCRPARSCPWAAGSAWLPSCFVWSFAWPPLRAPPASRDADRRSRRCWARLGIAAGLLGRCAVTGGRTLAVLSAGALAVSDAGAFFGSPPRSAVGLAATLTDGGDKLALAHSGGAFDADLLGQRPQLGQHHGW